MAASWRYTYEAMGVDDHIFHFVLAEHASQNKVWCYVGLKGRISWNLPHANFWLFLILFPEKIAWCNYLNWLSSPSTSQFILWDASKALWQCRLHMAMPSKWTCMTCAVTFKLWTSAVVQGDLWRLEDAKGKMKLHSIVSAETTTIAFARVGSYTKREAETIRKVWSRVPRWILKRK